MQVTDDLFEEILITHCLVYLLHIVFREHARNLTTTQEVVYVLEERLVDYMILGE